MLEETQAIKVIVDACIRLKPDEDLVVLADDYARPQAIAQAVAAAAKARGARVVYMVVPPKLNNAEEPRKTAAAAMRAADAIFGAGERVSVTSGHTNLNDELMGRGARNYATLGLTEDYLRRPVSIDDVVEMKARSERIVELYNQADTVRLATPHGTDLTFSIEGRHGTPLHPIRGIFVPDYAEAPVPPVEGTANGTLVYDGELDGWGYTLSRPLVLKVAKGKVTDISGNPEDVDRLRRVVSIDAEAGNIGEFAIGTSHTVPGRLSGTRYDCAILGTVHIGLGRNTLLGGKSMSSSHIDGIMTRPTVELDGKTIVADGKVLV
ncbi:MAG: aminopeptidase [Chloroflexi bacterium]|nr:aminopeptidase [Chloroflexota bacterium]